MLYLFQKMAIFQEVTGFVEKVTIWIQFTIIA